jgi:hypothetical protein
MRGWISLPAFLFSVPAIACPFCDLGGQATALFIVSFLGFICLGMFAFFLAHLKSGGLKDSNQTAHKIFEAENRSVPPGGKSL